MTEDFLHFIWKFGLFEHTGMITDAGEEVQVISLGQHNSDAGPDFLNARIRIGQTTWAGNIEIHLRSTDWTDHRHHLDKSYDNVILHVVHKSNQRIARSSGEILPEIELQFNPVLYENYRDLLDHQGGLPCRDRIRQIDPFLLEMWLNSLVVERLQQRAQYIGGLLDHSRNNWDEAFYITLARGFGFGLNTLPFEMLAKSVPLAILARYRKDPFRSEAVLMGQAGFLEEERRVPGYYAALRKEYIHQQHKYGLKPVERHLWKFLRLRPVNFPTIRIAQLAVLVATTSGLFSRVKSCLDISELQKIFDVQATSFWDTHYTFEAEAPFRVKRLGTEAFQILVINVVVPFLFVYGQRTGQSAYKDRALEWLNGLPPEKNRVISRWNSVGMHPVSAFYSQGLMQMQTRYCSQKACLACSVGARLIQG
jgi:hypothetical protein